MVEHPESQGNRSSQVEALIAGTNPDELYFLVGELVVRMTAQHARRNISLGFSFIAEPELERREGYRDVVLTIARMKPGMQLAFRATKQYSEHVVSIDGAIVLNSNGITCRMDEAIDTSEATEHMLDEVWRSRND